MEIRASLLCKSIPTPLRHRSLLPSLGFICRRRRSHVHAGDCPDPTMLLRSDLTLRRISSTTQYSFRSNRCFVHHRKMAEQSTNKHLAISKSGDGQDNGQKSAPPPPPPPEKPLPGDCCGSGCVRCVWDIYYDELDEYNKLYNNPDSKKPPN